MPEYVRDRILSDCRPGLEVDFVFSGLPSSIAGEVESDFARAGYPVVSNSRNHRMDEDVPLLVPEINPDHLALIPRQQQTRKQSSGFIVTNPNCTTIALVLALAPLHRAFGLEQVSVVTMQALSGAGYPGVASLDVIDNVLPYIEGEEEKVETEPLKILGQCKNGNVEWAKFRISAQCHRVNVQDGHLGSGVGRLPAASHARSACGSTGRFPIAAPGTESAERTPQAGNLPGRTGPPPASPGPIPGKGDGYGGGTHPSLSHPGLQVRPAGSQHHSRGGGSRHPQRGASPDPWNAGRQAVEPPDWTQDPRPEHRDP